MSAMASATHTGPLSRLGLYWSNPHADIKHESSPKNRTNSERTMNITYEIFKLVGVVPACEGLDRRSGRRHARGTAATTASGSSTPVTSLNLRRFPIHETPMHQLLRDLRISR